MSRFIEIKHPDEMDHADFLEAKKAIDKRGTMSPADAAESVGNYLVVGNIAQFNYEFRQKADGLLQ